MALFAVAAGQASAFTWTTEKSMTPGTTMAVGIEAFGPTELQGPVSALLVDITAGKVEAIEGKIAQTGKETAGVATATGKLKYSELHLISPLGCGAPTSVTTTALKAEIAKAGSLFSEAGIKIRPASGTVLATITLTGTCALAGTPIKVTIPAGSFFCAEVEKFGTMAVRQESFTSAPTNGVCGGASLETAGNLATLAGAAFAFSLENLGQSWGVSESGSL
jgi:hypothetical protein